MGRAPSLLLVAVLPVVMAGCSGTEAPSAAPAAPSWSLAPEPDLVLGEVEGDALYLFSAITDARMLSTGDIAILDGGSAELRVFGPDGEVRWIVGGKGEGPGELDFPTWVRELRGGELMVFDFNDRRVTVFDIEGRLIRTRSLDALGSRSRAPLPALMDGRMVAWRYPDCCPLGERSFAIFGDSLAYVRMGEEGIDTLLVVPGPERVAVRDGDLPMSFPLPLGRRAVTAVGSGFVIVGDGLEPEVRLLRGDGSVRALALPTVRQPLLEPTWEAVTASFLEGRSGLQLRLRELALDQIPRPDSLPAYEGLAVDSEDRIWVREHRLGGPQHWTVTGLDGAPLARVTLPDSMALYQAGSDRVLLVFQDALGVQRIALWRLISS